MPSDCLVLKIEEVEPSNSVEKVVDNQIFVIFDTREKRYILRGKRNDTRKINFEPYSFNCDTSYDVVNFLSFIVDKNNLLNYILYNVSDLPLKSEEISFESLVNSVYGECELVGYENSAFSKKVLKNNIQILRYMYNDY
jgi:hypothetical protein